MNRLKRYLNSGGQRSVLAKKNILSLFLNKGVAIIISLLLVPISINYLNKEEYGIWLTISSIISWISYFDVGLVHGFKNRFATAKANNDTALARQYVSTTYAVMFIVFSIVIVIAEIITPYINWASLLGIAYSYNEVLINVCRILFFFVGIHLMLGVITAVLTADQHSAYAAIIVTIGQAIILLGIYILTILPVKNMLYMAITISAAPCLVLLIASIYLFRTKYREYTPSITHIRWELLGNILGLGGKFFIIQISMLLIFQVVNIIISRNLGSESVTLFNVSYKYFSILQMVFVIILSPFWAAYTDAYTKKDYTWMKHIFKKLQKTFYIALIPSFIMLIASPLFFEIWLPESIQISWLLSFTMWIYILTLTYSNIFMNIINGIGKVAIQTTVYVISALFSIPLCSYLSSKWGITGILLVLSAVYCTQAILAKIQLNKLLNNKATGLWNR